MKNKRTQIKKLDGLPAYGPMALPFSGTGRGYHHEGLVVEFQIDDESWVGNFQPGLTKFNDIGFFPGSGMVFVVSNGEGYLINPYEKKCLQTFIGSIEGLWISEKHGFVIFHTGIYMVARDHEKEIWKSKRISWDGFRNLTYNSESILGEAWSPDDKWYPFEVKTRNGELSGGSY